MNLNFLHPWFLLGALAIGVPLWLHLRRKTETNLLRFPTLRFLEDNPQPRASPLTLQDVLLFLLRVLVLLLLVAAFAWPYRRSHDQIRVKESRVYILDNSLSHQANGGFIRDRDRIADEVRRAGPEIQIAVAELTGQPRVVAGFSDGRDEVRQKVKELAPSFQRGSYLAVFRLAHGLLANSMGERKRIVFYTDNQENQWSENANTPPFLHHIDVDAPAPTGSNAPNLALSEPRLQRVFLGDKSLLNFTVKLTHSGAAKVADVNVHANGQLIFKRAVELANQPEAILLQAQWEADPALWLGGVASVEGAPDALAGDNRAFFSLAPVREGTVALLALSHYVRLALSPEVMRGHWAVRVLDPARLANEMAASQDAEVLLIESTYLQSADARKLVWRYLTNGRGVFLMVNRVSPVINAALRELGFEAAGGLPSESSPARRFQYVFSNHAIFHPFLSPDYGNLLEVVVGRHPRLKAVQAMPLIFSESSEPVFFQGTKFPGRLYVAAFGFEREQTSWPTHVTFIPFLDLCLQNSRPTDTTPLDYDPGATALLNFPADLSAREVVLRDDRREWQRAPVTQGRTQLRLPDQPGLYSVSWDDGTGPGKIFSVNPSPKESELKFVASPEALKVWKLDRGDEAAKAAAMMVQDRLSLAAILQQQLWWWLLLAALAALLAETLWTSARKRTL